MENNLEEFIKAINDLSNANEVLNLKIKYIKQEISKNNKAIKNAYIALGRLNYETEENNSSDQANG